MTKLTALFAEQPAAAIIWDQLCTIAEGSTEGRLQRTAIKALEVYAVKTSDLGDCAMALKLYRIVTGKE